MAFLQRLVLIAGLCCFLSGAATAQGGRKGVSTPDPLAEELGRLIYGAQSGFATAYSIFARSFAAHLPDATPRLSAEALSLRSAAYDPLSGPGLTPGMVLFHMARPLEIMEDMDALPRRVQARVLDYRLRWLAGDGAAALDRVTALIGELEALGVGAAGLSSILADGAVLALRAGRGDLAREWAARAAHCRKRNCPGDLVFALIGSKSRRIKGALPGYSAEAMRDAALARAGRMFPGNTEIADQVRLEYLYVTGRALPRIRATLERAQATRDSATPTPRQRRDMRAMALRLANVFDMESYLMSGDSVAGTVTSLDTATGRPATDALEDVEYLRGRDSWSREMLIRRVPLFVQLLRQSDGRGDGIVAGILRIRLLLVEGARDAAARELQALIARARAEGFTNAELHSAWMDLWAVAVLTGDTATVERAEAAVAPCLAAPCSGDLVQRFFRAAEVPQKMARDAGLLDLSIEFAEPVLRAMFPDDDLLIADLHATNGDMQKFPLDAARRMRLAFRMAERVADIAPADLVARAAGTMDTLIYAGDYDAAAAIADRVVARVDVAALQSTRALRFLQYRGRAAFRIGDGRAGRLYREAVDLALALAPGDAPGTSVRDAAADLALDLLDTGFLDVLDRLAEGTKVHPGVVARLRFRQGRPDAAAVVLMQARREVEARDKAREAFAALLSDRASQARKRRDRDTADTLAALRAAVLAGAPVPPDHPLFYQTDLGAANLAYQESVYRAAAGDAARARALRDLALAGGEPAQWTPLDKVDAEQVIAAYRAGWNGLDDSYDEIRALIALRDFGLFEAAALRMRGLSALARAAEINGSYTDAQTLWQMAFTFARVGEADIAFDLMNRAARLAANLSFEGAGGPNGGTLQLLERDRWRYLLFVDIAWAAVLGQAPETMSVVSRY